MKTIFTFSILLLLIGSCVSTRQSTAPTEQLIDVQVQQWLRTHNANSSDTLAVLVKTDRAVSAYPSLKLIKDNFYGGHVSYKQIQMMLKDKHVLRIYAGRKRLH